MHYIVYQITNRINGNIYVGVHQTTNVDDEYMGSGLVLQRAIAKYGPQSFEKTILYDFDNPYSMFDKEAEIVDESFIARHDTYNLKLGGHGGFDYVNRNGKNLYGLNGSFGRGRENLLPGDVMFEKLKREGREQEFRQAVSAGLRKAYDEGHVNGFTGKSHSDETREKISKANAGRGMGKTNSQFGTRWVRNKETGEVKKIRRDELDAYLRNGFTPGRK